MQRDPLDRDLDHLANTLHLDHPDAPFSFSTASFGFNDDIDNINGDRQNGDIPHSNHINTHSVKKNKKGNKNAQINDNIISPLNYPDNYNVDVLSDLEDDDYSGDNKPLLANSSFSQKDSQKTPLKHPKQGIKSLLNIIRPKELDLSGFGSKFDDGISDLDSSTNPKQNLGKILCYFCLICSLIFFGSIIYFADQISKQLKDNDMYWGYGDAEIVDTDKSIDHNDDIVKPTRPIGDKSDDDLARQAEPK
jgi:hypothetical protein